MNNNIKNEIQEYQKQFENSPAERYVCNRGISKQTYQQFDFGYKKGSFTPTGDCLIIPLSDTAYIEKLLKNHEYAPKYKNINSGIFNYKVLHNANAPIFCMIFLISFPHKPYLNAYIPLSFLGNASFFSL